MKLKLLVIALIYVCPSVKILGQVGLLISGSNHFFNPDNVSDHLQAETFKHVDGGLSYGFGLKNVRLELHPGIAFGYGTGDFLNSDLAFKQMAATFSVPIIFYPLDFKSDCNCPTFNKQGEVFEKGLYFLLQPGVSHVWRNVKDLTEAKEFKGFQPELGLGIGFDFGLSRQSTLSVFLMMARTFNGNYNFAEDKKLWQKSPAHMNFEMGFRYLWYSNRRR